MLLEMTREGVEITGANVEVWKLFLSNSLRFLDVYRGLLDTYVLDFFTEDLWSCINHRWTHVLELLTPEELACFLSEDTKLRQGKVWPLSLLAFRAAAFTCALPRNPIINEASFLKYINKHCPSTCAHELPSSDRLPGKDLCENINLNDVTDDSKCKNICTSASSSQSDCKNGCTCASSSHIDCYRCNNVGCVSGINSKCSVSLNGEHVTQKVNEPNPLQQTAISWGDATSELSPEGGQHKLLQHVFRRHLKPKKQHEVARLAYIAGKVAHVACEGVLVDVGSGQGHLSRFLAYGHNVRIVCLEAQDEFIKGAKKFDSQLELAVKKMKESKKYDTVHQLPPSPRHAVCHLDVNMDPLMFKKVVSNTWPELDSNKGMCGLLGLHTCGNLAPTLLRIFTHLPMCQAVVSVGCCYMKLNESSDAKESQGYPMSDYVKAIHTHALSYEAREVACHAIEMYVDRLKLGADNLKVHCYRAALEEIVIKRWPEHRHAGLRSVNHAHKMPFAEYATAAVNRLDKVKLNEDDLSSGRTKDNLSRWMQVVVYYSLRLMLAPVVESVVLLDRLLYLYENNVEGVMLPAFDPRLSPRNHVLIAIKSQNRL